MNFRDKKFNIIILTIISITIFSGIFVFIKNKASTAQNVPDIEDKLLIPYRKALADKKYEFAYKQFTSQRYKSEYSYEEFLDSQLQNFATFGSLISIKPASGMFVKESLKSNPWDVSSQNWLYKGTLVYTGSNKNEEGKYITAGILMEIIVEEGEYKIYDSYNSFVTIGGIKPQIF